MPHTAAPKTTERRDGQRRLLIPPLACSNRTAITETSKRMPGSATPDHTPPSRQQGQLPPCWSSRRGHDRISRTQHRQWTSSILPRCHQRPEPNPRGPSDRAALAWLCCLWPSANVLVGPCAEPSVINDALICRATAENARHALLIPRRQTMGSKTSAGSAARKSNRIALTLSPLIDDASVSKRMPGSATPLHIHPSPQHIVQAPYRCPPRRQSDVTVNNVC